MDCGRTMRMPGCLKELVLEEYPGTFGRAKEPSLVAVLLSLSEIGRAVLHGMTETGTTQGVAQSSSDQAQEHVRSWGNY